ncbi:hypothetical protein FGG08_004152 [Glutinoglossum americanum]|uniref:Uncharacterized protein n=1 Tax=Glutinoglossum americanum TaxID=1670608 RepID=A0A9P8L2T1_9PEZI|nr:hypothetical protein FGG08_004152 [Glutinoglossum americanum]
MSTRESKRIQFSVGERVWEEAQGHLQSVIDSLPSDCEPLRKLLQQMEKARPKPAEKVYQASGLTLEQAKALLSIEYDNDSPQYVWDLHEELAVKEDELGSSWAFNAINQIKNSRYYKYHGDESLLRSAVDILLCGRLEHLADDGTNHHLKVAAEVEVHTKARQPDAVELSGIIMTATIRGRADWMLGYALTKKNLDGMLVVVEAKRDAATSKAIPQMMSYLAGVQDARAETGEQNHQVFGIMTDSSEFRFAFLNENRQMFLSNTLFWRTHATKIVAFLDYILQKAIESSPHTMPVKKGNHQLLNYPRHLPNSFSFGETEGLTASLADLDLAAVDVGDDSTVTVAIDILDDPMGS